MKLNLNYQNRGKGNDVSRKTKSNQLCWQLIMQRTSFYNVMNVLQRDLMAPTVVKLLAISMTPTYKLKMLS